MSKHIPLSGYSAKDKHLKTCLQCGQIMSQDIPICQLCGERVYLRKPNSLSKTTAYLITAFILFFPANLLPIMTTTSIMGSQSDTILTGILHLWHSGAYPIAIIVFVASFITPLFKMLSIAYLSYSCAKQSDKQITFRTKLYHFTELIGRWSMIDVFVVALLGALVKMGALATIEPRSGIVAFTLVVVLTMLSMNAFDPRLIWDHYTDNRPPLSPTQAGKADDR